MTLRALTEQAARHLVFPRRLPREFGRARFWVSPAAGLRYLFKPMRKVDPILLDFANRYIGPDDVVWDVGANMGLFSFAAASRAKYVLAIEPDVDMIRLLRRTSKTLDILPVAITRTVGISKLCIARRSRAANFMEGFDWSTQHGGAVEQRTVITLSLDWIAERFPLPTIIKMDIEGAELEALEGATFIAKQRPTMLLEISDEIKHEVTLLLRSWNYSIIDGLTHQEVDTATWDTIAVPA